MKVTKLIEMLSRYTRKSDEVVVYSTESGDVVPVLGFNYSKEGELELIPVGGDSQRTRERQWPDGPDAAPTAFQPYRPPSGLGLKE